MSRFTGGVPLVWVGALLVGAALTSAVSTVLAHRFSPAIVASLPLIAVGLLVIQRYGIKSHGIRRYGVQSYGVAPLILLLLSLPLGRLTLAEVGPVPVSPVTALVGVAVMVWLWRVLAGSEKIEASHMQLPLALFLLCGVVGLFGALDLVMGMKTLFIFLMGASVYLVASQTIRSVEEAQGVMWAAACAVAIIGAYTAATGTTSEEGNPDTQEVSSGGATYERAEGVFGHPNLLGGFLALAIPFMVALAASDRLWWRQLLGFLLVVAATTGLAFTYSRGAWLGAGVGLLVLLPVLKKKSFGLLLAVPVLAGILATTGQGVIARFQSIGTAESDPAFTSRPGIWSTALTLVEENPLLGVGLGNFEAAYANVMIPNLPLLSYSLKIPQHAHNLFLQLGAEVGLIGAAAFAWLLAVAFLRAWQVRRFADRRVRLWSMGMAAGLVAMLVHTFVDVIIYQGFVAVLFFAFLGIMDALKRLDDRQIGHDEHTPPRAAPASTTGRRSTSTHAVYADADRHPATPVRHRSFRGAGLSRAQTEDTSETK